jgi:hypothetical protein
VKLNWTNWAIFVLIVLINIAAKFSFLDDSSFFLDEAYSVYYAQQDWDGMSVIFEKEANPPTYFVILHYWIKVFGITEIGTRLLSLISYSLAAGVVFLIAKKWLTTVPSLILAIGFSFSESLLFLGCETRVHTLTVLASSISVLALIHVFKNPSFKSILIHGLSLILLFYLHYANSILIGIQVLLVAIFLIDQKRFKKSAIYLLPLVAIIPLLLGMTDAKVSSTAGWMTSPSTSDILPLLQVFSNGSQLLTWLAISVAVIGLIISKKGMHRAIHLMPILYIALGFLISQRIPLFAERYLATFVLLSTVSIGALASQIRIKPASVILLSMWSFAMFFTFQPRTDKGDDWRGVAEYVATFQIRPDVLISPVFEYRSYLYYADKDEFEVGKNAHKRCFEKRIYFANQIDDKFFEYVKPEELLYISRKFDIDPSLKVIEKEFSLAEEHWFGSVNVKLYTK